MIRIVLIVSWANQTKRKELILSEADTIENTNKKLTDLLDSICTEIGKEEQILYFGKPPDDVTAGAL